MPRFSLIVATISRTDELKRLLESFSRQEFSDYEVILVDQNDDDRLQAVIEEFFGAYPCLEFRPRRGYRGPATMGFGRLPGS